MLQTIADVNFRTKGNKTMTYLFQPKVTMKPYNCENWWVTQSIIPDIKITAKSLNEALEKFRDHARETAGIEISNTALKTKAPMFIDTANGGAEQIGYVITGSLDFYEDDMPKSVKQYINIWVEISGVVKVFTDKI